MQNADELKVLRTLVAMRDLTREQIAGMTEHERKVLVSFCRRLLADIDRTERSGNNATTWS